MTKTPSQVGQDVIKVVHKASGTKKRHDALLLTAMFLKKTTPKFDISTFTDMLARKLKDNEGIIISYDMFFRLFGNKPTQFDVEAMQSIMTSKDLSIVPLYKKMGTEVIATFLIIHRKLYRAMELADEMREIITGEPIRKNPKAWLVGTAIKISEELGHLIEKASVVYKYDIIDALNILRGDEVYFISYNFLIMNRLDPRELTEILASKKFFVDKILSDTLRDKESNEHYKDIAEIAGLSISKTETGISIGREHIDILFRISEQVDTSIRKAQTQNALALTGATEPTKH